MDYAIHRSMPGFLFEDVLTRVRVALQGQGFGIPVEMDTQALFMAKLNRSSEKRVILGACLASVAFEALKQEPDLSVLLPCNVVVRDVEGGVDVTAVSPKVLFSLTEKVDPLYAQLVEDKLKAALDSIA